MKVALLTPLVVLLAGVGNANAKQNTVLRTTKLIENVWHQQTVMGMHRTPTNRSYVRTHSERYRQWVLHYWRRVAAKTWRQFTNVPYKSAWECIHNYEAGWDYDKDLPGHNGYYDGGLQMDESFQSSYGSYLLRKKGPANYWTPLEQMWVAYKAHRSGRGFYPWPNTARYCGLI